MFSDRFRQLPPCVIVIRDSSDTPAGAELWSGSWRAEGREAACTRLFLHWGGTRCLYAVVADVVTGFGSLVLVLGGTFLFRPFAR